MIQEVYLAQPYNQMELGSFGKARCMLLRQFNFPLKYENALDVMSGSYDDRLFDQDNEHAKSCYKKYMNKDGRCLIPYDWIRNSSDELIMDFLKEIMKVDEFKKGVKWTGYRITISIRTDDGCPYYLFELFAKHKDTETEVYSEQFAPNVQGFPCIIVRF